MALINCTSDIGSLFCSASTAVTGDVGLTLLGFTILAVAFMITIRLPLEIAIITILPFLMISALISGSMVTVLGVALFYLSVVILRNLFLQ